MNRVSLLNLQNSLRKLLWKVVFPKLQQDYLKIPLRVDKFVLKENLNSFYSLFHKKYSHILTNNPKISFSTSLVGSRQNHVNEAMCKATEALEVTPRSKVIKTMLFFTLIFSQPMLKLDCYCCSKPLLMSTNFVFLAHAKIYEDSNLKSKVDH